MAMAMAIGEDANEQNGTLFFEFSIYIKVDKVRQ